MANFLFEAERRGCSARDHLLCIVRVDIGRVTAVDSVVRCGTDWKISGTCGNIGGHM